MRPMMLAAAALLLTPAALAAQPLPRPHPELPSDDQPARKTATTGYTLSLIWTPEHCHARRSENTNDSECAGPSSSRFMLHGLWPDGDGANRWPQYCRPVAILSDAELRTGYGATPSAQLLQHEWSKHGSCMTDSASAYFADEGRAFASIRYPDMRALSRRHDLTVTDFQASFAAANPGMRANMLRLNVNKHGWLEEVWICLGLNKQPRPCPAFAGGAKPGEPVRIQSPYPAFTSRTADAG
jgi:ribonuclease T2